MHEAYTATQLLKLPLSIESLARSETAHLSLYKLVNPVVLLICSR